MIRNGVCRCQRLRSHGAFEVATTKSTSYRSGDRFLLGPHFTANTGLRWGSSSSSDSLKIYKGPMGDLITRLKMVSITSCLAGLVGLPLLISIQNGGEVFVTAQQAGLGGVAVVGATGSTLALHFVFGPYITEMERIPIRKCHTASENAELDTKTTGADDSNMINSYLIKASKRNIFGLRQEIVFDPETDLEKYTGTRPFGNFVAKDVPLYAHIELIEDVELQKKLLELLPSEAEQESPSKDDDFL